MLGDKSTTVWVGGSCAHFVCPREPVAQVYWNLPCLLQFPSCGSSVDLDENVGSLLDCDCRDR